MFVFIYLKIHKVLSMFLAIKNPLMFSQCPPGDHTLGLFYLTVSQVTVPMFLF